MAPRVSFPEETTGLAGFNIWKWGPIDLHPHVNYSMTYAKDIQSAPGEGETTVVQSFAAGMLFNLRDHWSLDYTPSLSFYSNDEFKDTLDHGLNLSGRAQYGNWSFGLLHQTLITSEPLVETGQQTDQQTHNSSLNAAYLLNSKASLQFGLDQNLRFASGFSSSREWSGNAGFNYQFWRRLRGGVNFSAGYVDVEAGSDMTFEQLNGTLSWLSTDKLTFSLNVGGEMRQFLDTDARDLINPIFGAIATWRPFEPTSFSLSASHGVSASYFDSEVIESTSLSAGWQQRFLKHFYLTINGGFQISTYKSSTGDTPTDREDDGFNVGGSLSTIFLRRFSASVFYNYHENSSSDGSFGFSSTQAGFSIGYRF
jgi:hypothetical protein